MNEHAEIVALWKSSVKSQPIIFSGNSVQMGNSTPYAHTNICYDSKRNLFITVQLILLDQYLVIINNYNIPGIHLVYSLQVKLYPFSH